MTPCQAVRQSLVSGDSLLLTETGVRGHDEDLKRVASAGRAV